MKVRWRENETILISILAIILLVSYLWKLHAGALNQLEITFVNNQFPFNLYRNVLIPDLGLGALAYFSYLYFNYFIISRLVSAKEIRVNGTSPGILRRYFGALIQILILIFVLLSVFNLAYYYKNQWQFNYPGSSFIPTRGYNPNKQLDIPGSFLEVLTIFFLYSIYAIARESIISYIEKHETRKAYRILIWNQLTIFLIIYISILFFAAAFRLINDGHITIYYFLIIPVFIVYVSNTYWIFPLIVEKSSISIHVVGRVLVSTFLSSLIVFILPFHEGSGFLFFILWTIQLFVITPVSWVLYQQRKDKILQLRGSENALFKSKTDLKFLRSQINPHFLFNVLNTLYGMALKENAELTADAIQKLGDIMRFMLHENNLERIQMDREVEYLNNYISLQQLRLKSSPEISINYKTNCHNYNHEIAPMLFLPFVENAFKHGISLTQESWIKITLECTEHEIHFEVRNSLHPHRDENPEKEGSGIGLINVTERLKILYPNKHTVSAANTGKEFLVNLSIKV